MFNNTLISASQRDVLKAVRHRSVVLQDLDQRRPGKHPRYYLTGVRLAFVFPPDYDPGPGKAFPHVLVTDQGRIEHPVQALNGIRPATFYGL